MFKKIFHNNVKLMFLLLVLFSDRLESSLLDQARVSARFLTIEQLRQSVGIKDVRVNPTFEDLGSSVCPNLSMPTADNLKAAVAFVRSLACMKDAEFSGLVRGVSWVPGVVSVGYLCNDYYQSATNYFLSKTWSSVDPYLELGSPTDLNFPQLLSNELPDELITLHPSEEHEGYLFPFEDYNDWVLVSKDDKNYFKFNHTGICLNPDNQHVTESSSARNRAFNDKMNANIDSDPVFSKMDPVLREYVKRLMREIVPLTKKASSLFKESMKTELANVGYSKKQIDAMINKMEADEERLETEMD